MFYPLYNAKKRGRQSIGVGPSRSHTSHGKLKGRKSDTARRRQQSETPRSCIRGVAGYCRHLRLLVRCAGDFRAGPPGVPLSLRVTLIGLSPLPCTMIDGCTKKRASPGPLAREITGESRSPALTILLAVREHRRQRTSVALTQHDLCSCCCYCCVSERVYHLTLWPALGRLRHEGRVIV